MDIERNVCLDLASNNQTEWLSYEQRIENQVYDTLVGNLVQECCLDWVEDICVPGQPSYEKYREMLEAYERVCERLGVTNEDHDVEIMINALLERGRILALKMFEYGRKYEKMRNT